MYTFKWIFRFLTLRRPPVVATKFQTDFIKKQKKSKKGLTQPTDQLRLPYLYISMTATRTLRKSFRNQIIVNKAWHDCFFYLRQVPVWWPWKSAKYSEYAATNQLDSFCHASWGGANLYFGADERNTVLWTGVNIQF